MNVACSSHCACNMKEHAVTFRHCTCIGTSRETGVSAWHKLTLCLVFNGGLCQRDNVLELHGLNDVSGSIKKG